MIKTVWNFLDKKKTVIGVIIHFLGYGLKGIGIINEATFSQIIMLGDAIMAGGLFHKGFKKFS